jgi:hypothetical protein
MRKNGLISKIDRDYYYMGCYMSSMKKPVIKKIEPL